MASDGHRVGLRLFHFSEDPSIDKFVPRAVMVPSERRPGMEWLNGPLVWAITEEREAAYLFPRDCPRILLWLTPDTTLADRSAWWGDRDASMIACVEWRWMRTIQSTILYRYELPTSTFLPLDEGWTWVSKENVEPNGVERYGDLLEALAACSVELRVMDSLRPLRHVWDTTLHASGIRLRHARDWS